MSWSLVLRPDVFLTGYDVLGGNVTSLDVQLRFCWMATASLFDMLHVQLIFSHLTLPLPCPTFVSALLMRVYLVELEPEYSALDKNWTNHIKFCYKHRKTAVWADPDLLSLLGLGHPAWTLSSSVYPVSAEGANKTRRAFLGLSSGCIRPAAYVCSDPAKRWQFDTSTSTSI